MKTTNNIARFVSGAKRTDRKPRFDLIPLEFLESLAHALSSGAVKYGPYNWKRGQKDSLSDEREKLGSVLGPLSAEYRTKPWSIVQD